MDHPGVIERLQDRLEGLAYIIYDIADPLATIHAKGVRLPPG
jgi:hypothetical protein